MHGDDHLSSSSEDDIEEWQYEDESDTFRESQAPNTLDDLDSTILIPQSTEDIDVLNPAAWVNNMKNVERQIFEHLYVLHSAAQSRNGRGYSYGGLSVLVAGDIEFDAILPYFFCSS